MATEHSEDFKAGADTRSTEILQDCIAAVGGTKLEQARDLVVKGNHLLTLRESGTDNDSIRKSTLTISGYKQHNAMVSGHFTYDHFNNGKSSWHLSNGEAVSFTEQALFPSDIVPWPGSILSWQDRNKIEFAGESTIEDDKFWKLKFTHVHGHKSIRFFHQETNLPVRVEYYFDFDESPRGVATFEFSQHEDLQLPLEIRDTILQDGEKKLIRFFVFTEIELDPEINQFLFEIPSKYDD